MVERIDPQPAEPNTYDSQDAVPKESIHRVNNAKVDWGEVDKIHERSRTAGLAMARKNLPRERWMEKQMEMWALSVDLLRLAMQGMMPRSSEFRRAGHTSASFQARIEAAEAGRL
jgi:hypothetical protein